MESKGKVVSVAQDFSGKTLLTIALEGANRAELETLEQDKDYRIKIAEWRNKRSLDANAYCWVLISKIAEKVLSSKDEIYENMLQKYGVLDADFPPITVISTADMGLIDGHWKRYRETEISGKSFTAYLRIKGSSEYDTKEMSNFIECVVSEAKELGIETKTPEEIERMKAEWKAS